MPRIAPTASRSTTTSRERGSRSCSFRTWLPITPVTRFRWRSTRSTSPASRSTFEGRVKRDKPEGAYTTEVLADDVAAFMQAAGIRKAHVAGLSLGAAVGMWLAAKYPDKVQSLSLHSGWAQDAMLFNARSSKAGRSWQRRWAFRR